MFYKNDIILKLYPKKYRGIIFLFDFLIPSLDCNHKNAFHDRWGSKRNQEQ